MNKNSAQLTPVDDALEYLLSQVSTTQLIEYVPLQSATGRVLAQDQISQIDVPPWPNSAMDGYAVRFSDLQGQQPLPVSQRIPAGAMGGALAPNTAARMFTGAPVPFGADTVIMQEQCSVDAGLVRLPCSSDGVEKGQNIRAKAEDVRCGQRVLSSGTRLRAQELGLLASLGVDQVPVYQKLKIAVLSTGDELIEPGTVAGSGQIYNSNRYTLSALIDSLDMECIPMGIVADSREATETALCQAASKADLIISSGGVSVGEEDHVKAVIEQRGFLHLWKLAIKPGKPFAYGEFDTTPVLGLPGNPSAVLVTFLVLARPYLLKMQGVRSFQNTPAVVEADFDLQKKSIRRRYLHGQLKHPTLQSGLNLTEHELALPKVQIYPNQNSGMLSGASWGDGLAIVEVNQTICIGDRVLFYTFSDLLG